MYKFIAARKRQLIAFFVTLLVIVGIIGGLWVTNVFGWRQWRVQEAQGFIGASLPIGAANVDFTTRNTSTRIIWLRFNLIAGADLTTFLSQIGITDPLKDGFTPFPASNPQEAAITWWRPFVSTVFSGVYWNTGTKVIEILLDKTDSSQPVVYLRAYALGKT